MKDVSQTTPVAAYSGNQNSRGPRSTSPIEQDSSTLGKSTPEDQLVGHLNNQQFDRAKQLVISLVGEDGKYHDLGRLADGLEKAQAPSQFVKNLRAHVSQTAAAQKQKGVLEKIVDVFVGRTGGADSGENVASVLHMIDQMEDDINEARYKAQKDQYDQAVAEANQW